MKKEYRTYVYAKGYEVIQTKDGGYVIVGYASIQEHDAFLIKTDRYGNFIWNATYDTGSNDEGYSVKQTPDDGFIITGVTEYLDLEEDSQLWVFKTDKNGTLEWSKEFGGDNNDKGNSVQVTDDGDYIIVGVTQPYIN